MTTPPSPWETDDEIMSDSEESSDSDMNKDPRYLVLWFCSVNESPMNPRLSWFWNTANPQRALSFNNTDSMAPIEMTYNEAHDRPRLRRILDFLSNLQSHSVPFEFCKSQNPRLFLWSCSTANHFQCANALALGRPSVLKYADYKTGWEDALMQRPFVVNGDALFRCGGRSGQPDLCAYISASADPDVEVSNAVKVCRSSPICVASNYGFLAYGTQEGFFEVLSMAPGHKSILTRSFDYDEMVNSIDITQRIVRGTVTDDIEYTFLLSLNSAELHIIVIDIKADLTCRVIREFTYNPDMQANAINDAKISPDLRKVVLVGDEGSIWVSSIKYAIAEIQPEEEVYDDVLDDDEWEEEMEGVLNENHSETTDIGAATTWCFSSFHKISIARYFHDSSSVTMQYLSWNALSDTVAISSDSSPVLIIVRIPQNFDTNPDSISISVLPVAGTFNELTTAPTYCVSFHPTNSSLLAYSYRNSFVLLVDISTFSSDKSTLKYQAIPLFHYEEEFMDDDEWTGVKESSTVNGVKWSHDGSFLYIATRHRVLVYKSVQLPSLEKLALERLYSIYARVIDNDSLNGHSRDLDDTDRKAIAQVKDWAQSTNWNPFWWRPIEKADTFNQ